MKQDRELDLAKRFLTAIGCCYSKIESNDRPDINVAIGNRNIGIEVTEFHADRGSERKPGEQTLRQAGEESARKNPGQPYTMAIPTSPYQGLEASIVDKIDKAARYDLSRVDQLWLLISAQCPSLGALPATFIINMAIDGTELDRLFHEKLLASRFNRVCLHLISDHVVWDWGRSSKWRMIAARKTDAP